MAGSNAGTGSGVVVIIGAAGGGGEGARCDDGAAAVRRQPPGLPAPPVPARWCIAVVALLLSTVAIVVVVVVVIVAAAAIVVLVVVVVVVVSFRLRHAAVGWCIVPTTDAGSDNDDDDEGPDGDGEDSSESDGASFIASFFWSEKGTLSPRKKRNAVSLSRVASRGHGVAVRPRGLPYPSLPNRSRKGWGAETSFLSFFLSHTHTLSLTRPLSFYVCSVSPVLKWNTFSLLHFLLRRPLAVPAHSAVAEASISGSRGHWTLGVC